MTETGILTLAGMALLAVIALTVVRARRGKLSFKYKDVEGELDMTDNSPAAEGGATAGSGAAAGSESGARVGDIENVRVAEGATVDGNINIGHVVGGSVGGDAGGTPTVDATEDDDAEPPRHEH